MFTYPWLIAHYFILYYVKVTGRYDSCQILPSKHYFTRAMLCPLTLHHQQQHHLNSNQFPASNFILQFPAIPFPLPRVWGGLLAHKISSLKYAEQSCNLIWNVWEPGSILQHNIILKLPFNWRKWINRKFGTWVDQTLQEAQVDSCLLGKVVRTNTIAFEYEEKQLDSLRAEWN